MASEKHASCNWLAAFDKIHYHNEVKSIHVLPILWPNLSQVKIPNQQLHFTYTRSPIAAAVPFPPTNVSTSNPNVMNSQHTPLCMNINDVIIQYTHQQTETQNLTKKLQIITHPFTLQSAAIIPTQNAYPGTTVWLVHSTFTMTHLQLGSYWCASYWLKSI